MYKKTSLLAAVLLFSPFASGEELPLFDKASAFWLGAAARTMGNSITRGTERRVAEDPEHADEIRANEKIMADVTHKADEKLFEASGVDVGSIGTIEQEDGPDIEVGVYGEMLAAGNQDGNTELYTIPSKRWLTLQGFDINKAVGLRIPKTEAAKMIAGENGMTFKPVIMADIANLRRAFLSAGEDKVKVMAKIAQIVSIGNTAYADFLVK